MNTQLVETPKKANPGDLPLDKYTRKQVKKNLDALKQVIQKLENEKKDLKEEIRVLKKNVDKFQYEAATLKNAIQIVNQQTA